MTRSVLNLGNQDSDLPAGMLGAGLVTGTSGQDADQACSRSRIGLHGLAGPEAYAQGRGRRLARGNVRAVALDPGG